MKSSFRLVALEYGQFAPLFAKSDAELREVGAGRIVVRKKPGTPCRVSLADAEVGETVLLLPFTHHDVLSPYRASGPIFVRSGVMTAKPGIGEIPVMFKHRLLSVRAYDAAAMMLAADVVMGDLLEDTILRLLGDSAVEYLHIHNARPGCYNCRVERT